MADWVACPFARLRRRKQMQRLVEGRHGGPEKLVGNEQKRRKSSPLFGRVGWIGDIQSACHSFWYERFLSFETP